MHSKKQKKQTHYKLVPYPFALVNPIETATTKAGNPKNQKTINSY